MDSSFSSSSTAANPKIRKTDAERMREMRSKETKEEREKRQKKSNKN